MFSIFKKKNKISDFTIEYYPLSGKYYPKYKEFYLQRDYYSHVIQPKENQLYANKFNKESEARKFLEEFKEQEFKETIKIIEC